MINITSIQFLDLISNEKVDEIKALLKRHGKVIELWAFIEENDYNVLHKITYKSLKKDGLLESIIDYAKKYMDEVAFKKFINARTVQGFTALHYASYRGDIDNIKLLIENGGDYTAITNKKLTMIHMAAQGNQPSSLCYFKEKYNIDIDLVDSVKSTPLHWACYLGSELAVKFLLSWNVNYNAQDHEGLTPLHLTILSEKKKIAKQLLHKGANKLIVNNKGETAYDFAVIKQKQAMVDMLKDQKCNQCRLKVPLEKIEKSVKNIIIFLIAHFFVLYATFWLFFQLKDINVIVKYVYYAIMPIEFVLFIILVFSNPGRLKTKKDFQITLLELVETKVNISTYCPTCMIPITSKSRHCFICDECIDHFDHHCYWVNNCIGKRNYIFFGIFLIWTNAEVIFNIYIQIKTLIILIPEYNSSQSFKWFPYLCNDEILLNNYYIIGLCVLCLIICFIFSFPLLILLGFNGMNLLSLYKCKLRRRKTMQKIKTTIAKTPLVTSFQNSFSDA